MTSTYFETAFRFTDPGETEQYLIDTYGDAVINREFLSFGQELAGDEGIQVHTGRFDGSYSCSVESNQFVVASAGTSWLWEEGRDSGDMSTEPVLFRPGLRHTNHLENTENQAVIFSPVSLQRTARLVYGWDDRIITFEGPRPASTQAGNAVRAALFLARSEQQAGLLRNDLIRANLFRLLSVTVLESFRLVGERREVHETAERQRKIYRTATEFIHDHAHLAITVDDAAEAAGVSIPELVLAFRALDIQQMSPSTYLRVVRLDSAHEDLRTSNSGPGDSGTGATVAEIGRRWGFSSTRRFAAQHRTAYGVDPGTVLEQ